MHDFGGTTPHAARRRINIPTLQSYRLWSLLSTRHSCAQCGRVVPLWGGLQPQSSRRVSPANGAWPSRDALQLHQSCTQWFGWLNTPQNWGLEASRRPWMGWPGLIIQPCLAHVPTLARCSPGRQWWPCTPGWAAAMARSVCCWP